MSGITVLIFQLVVLIFSVMIHEVAHGVAAFSLGDNTARDAGRLTLNPLKHIDWFGSIVLPLLLLLSGSGVLIGWAKPVPYNPYNLKNPKRGAGLIGLAGPASNLILAVIFGVLIRVLYVYIAGSGMILNLVVLFNLIVYLNILLAIFNLVPIPPLDGSNILFAFLPNGYYPIRSFLERYGLIILIIFVFWGFGLILPIIQFLYRLIVGPAALI